jgi:hypothetical protein
MASDIGIAAWWWRIMSLKNSTSATSGGTLLKRSISSGEAMPGMGPSMGCPIQAMAGSVPLIGRPHTCSQPCMMPI